MKSIAFYNVKAGVGCTSLVYHLGWMYAELGYRVVVVDADPQGDLSGLFLGFDGSAWEADEARERGASIGDAIRDGVSTGHEFLTSITPTLALVLSSLRQEPWIAEKTDAHGLCYTGPRASIPGDLASARVRRLVAEAGAAHGAELVLLDASPGLGVSSCLAVTAADAVVFPVTPDSPAVAGLHEAVYAVNTWRGRWDAYVDRLLDPAHGPVADEADASWLRPAPTLLGHVVTGDAYYLSGGVRVYIRTAGIARDASATATEPLGKLTGWVGLRDMWLQYRKPMFALSPADGAIGSTAVAVQRCRKEYAALARTLAERLGVPRR